MANLKEIRTRIASVTSTKQITSAMKMVAAAKLRKAQNTITKLSPYSQKMAGVLALLSETLAENADNVFTSQKPIKKMLAVAISSNKGLCGGFNSYVYKSAVELHDDCKSKNIDVKFYTIGKKISEGLEKRGFDIYKTNNDVIDKADYQSAENVANELTSLYVNGDFDCIKIIYNKFVNAAVQRVEQCNFLPLSFSVEKSKFKTDYIFEPDKNTIVSKLIPQWLKTLFYQTIADSAAGEQGARMTAMSKATDNATELIKELNLSYNKVRQASITNEIIEIVSGASAAK